MIRARFAVNDEDPRPIKWPIKWPIKHPYWITGYAIDHAIIVAYADDEAQIKELWPEVKDMESEEVDHYQFTTRFQKPERRLSMEKQGLRDKWMNRSPGYDCLICGERANHETLLFTVFSTRLCIDHLNEFAEYTIKRGWARKLASLEAVRGAVVRAYRGKTHQMSAIEKWTAEVERYKDKLYYECKAWVTDKIQDHIEAVNESEAPATKYFEGDMEE